jgi:hypothetical protein
MAFSFIGPPTKTLALATGPLARYLQEHEYKIGKKGRFGQSIDGKEYYYQLPHAPPTFLKGSTVNANESQAAYSKYTTHPEHADFADARIIIAPYLSPKSEFKAYTTFIGSAGSMHLGKNANLLEAVECKIVWVDKGYNLCAKDETFQNKLANPECDELSRHDPECRMKKSLFVDEAQQQGQHIPEWTVTEAPSSKEPGPYDKNRIIFTPYLAEGGRLHHGPTFVGSPGGSIWHTPLYICSAQRNLTV